MGPNFVQIQTEDFTGAINMNLVTCLQDISDDGQKGIKVYFSGGESKTLWCDETSHALSSLFKFIR